MNKEFAAAMRRAAGATRAFNVAGATRIIQKALGTGLFSRFTRYSGGAAAPTGRGSEKTGKTQVGKEPAKIAKAAQAPDTAEKHDPKKSDTMVSGSLARVPARLRRPLSEVLDTLRKVTPAPLAPLAYSPGVSGFNNSSVKQLVPAGAQFTARSFTSSAGTRAYKLYVPASAEKKPKGLVLMLHGCTQSPDDFATGTGMNAIAEKHGLLIAYPTQTGRDNAASCWNWFETGHQLRDAGEPAILAGLTRKLIKEFGIQKDQVFVAGLSAGAAMAVIMGKAYPELFDSVGVHSGLSYQSAGNVMSAMAVMRGKAGSRLFAKPQPTEATSVRTRTIIFQGTADRTVHPSNAQRIFEMAAGGATKSKSKTTSGSINGRAYKKTIIPADNGEAIVESWLVEGAGHAWFGGNPSGSYADPDGPDASAEMVRFFLKRK